MVSFYHSCGIVASLLSIVLIVIAIVAYFLAIAQLVQFAKDKGYEGSTSKLWFIGIVLTPLLLGVMVAAMPDRAHRGDQQ